MTDCISQDRIVDLVVAVQRPVLEALDHVASCPKCRAEIAALDRLGDMFGMPQPLPPGFVDRVLGEMEATQYREPAADSLAGSEVPLGSWRRFSVWRPSANALTTMVVAAASGLAACTVLIGSGTASGSSVAVTPLSVLLGLGVGAGLAAYDLLTAQEAPLPPPARGRG